MRYLVIWFLCSLLCQNTSGQIPLYKNFTTEDGLPTDEVYYACQDSAGFIWIGTENGLVQYDGNKFKTYTIDDGLTYNVILKIQPGIDNKLWIFTYPTTLCYYKDGKIYKHPISDSISVGLSFITDLYEAEDSTLYIKRLLDNHITIYKDGKTTKYSNWERYEGNEKRKYLRCIEEINGRYFSYPDVASTNDTEGPDQEYGYDTATYSNLNAIKKDQKLTYFEIAWTVMLSNLVITPDSTFIIGYNDNRDKRNLGCQNKLLAIKDGKIVTQKDCPGFKINYLYIDHNNNLLVACHGALYVYPNCDIESTPQVLFKGDDIGCVRQDHENNYWVTSTKSGLYFIPNFGIKKSSEFKSKKIFKLATFNDYLIVNTTDGEFYITDSSFKSTKLDVNFINIDLVTQLLNKQLLITENSKAHFYNTNGPSLTPDHTEVLGTYTNHYIHQPTQYEYLLNSYLIFDGDESTSIIKRKVLVGDTFKQYSFKDICLKSDTFWITTLSGLITLSNNKLGYNYNNPIKLRTNDISILANGDLVISTKQNGLIIRDGSKNIFITTKEGLPSNIIHSFFVDGNKVWLATGSGLAMVECDQKGYTVNSFENLSTRTLGKITVITKFHNYIVLGTSAGLCYFKEDALSPEKRDLPIVISSLLVNNTATSIGQNLTFERNQNNLEVSYQGFSYRSPSLVRYKYVLEGYSEDTIYTQNTTLQYTNLPYGDFTFKVFASTDNVNWSITPAMFSFTINMHYTETWWFVGLMILLGILVISSIFLIIIRNLRRRNSLQKELIMTEQKALRAQMNPHFTFNALNSIQYFLTDNDRRSATTFLSKFSMLVRKVLYNSSENLIKLEEEIDTLRLYLDLEQLRFSDKLDIEINVDEQLDLEAIYIPSMIIQPFLENAIWHGIMPKEEGKGILKLDFSLENDHLVCRVTDNGIGREKSAELKSQIRKGHKSTGLKNIQERIEVLNHINKAKISLEITDLTDNNNEASGTEICIYFELENED